MDCHLLASASWACQNSKGVLCKFVGQEGNAMLSERKVGPLGQAYNKSYVWVGKDELWG